MISLFTYTIGFLIYSLFCIITFNTFFKIEDEIKKKAGLLIIYIFYSLLIAYVIDFFDVSSNSTQKIFQILVYITAEGFFLWFYYKDILIPNTEKYR